MKLIKILACGVDGKQSVTQVEVADDYFHEDEIVAPVDPQADTDALLVDHEYRLVMLELGVTE